MMTPHSSGRIKAVAAALLALAFLRPDVGAADTTLDEIRARAGESLPLLAVHRTPQPVPEHVLLDGEERETSLGEFHGRILLVNFWATWCPPCRYEMPALDRLQAALGGPDFQVIAVNLDRNGLKRATEFYEDKSIRALDIHLDPRAEASGKMRVISLPTTLLIDRNGQEIARLAGIAEWDAESAKQFFRDVVELTRVDETAFLMDPNESCASGPCPDR